MAVVQSQLPLLENSRNSFGNLVAVRFFVSGNFHGNLVVCGEKFGAAGEEKIGLEFVCGKCIKISARLRRGVGRAATLSHLCVSG